MAYSGPPVGTLHDGDERYIILLGDRVEDLMAEVNINLDRYAPLGGVCSDGRLNYQAMMRRDTAAPRRRGGKRSNKTKRRRS